MAIPWLVGHATSTGLIEEAFTSAAFVGTVFFIGSAFTAMGLSRLEAVRVVTGSDWRSNRSWVVLVLGIAIALTLLAAPAAAFLGVPAEALLAAVVGPIQTFLFVLVLLMTPVILLGALLADLVQPLLPEGFGLGQITAADRPSSTHARRPSNLPSVLFYVILGALLVFELFVLGVMLWMRHQERRRMRALASEAFEERSIVIPPAGREREAPTAAATRRRSTAAGRPSRRLPRGPRARWHRDGRWARRAERDAGRPRRPHPGRRHGRRRVRPPGGRLPAGPLRRAAALRPRATALGAAPASAAQLAGSVLNRTIRW